MKTAFPDLLEKLRMHFESELKTHCYYADELCFPGFNIFRLSPNTERPLWFHYDDARSILEKNYPQFGVRSSDIRQIEGGSRQLTFTCLLDAPKGLTAGLLYFPQQAQGLKVMSVEEARHGEFEKMASFHKYDLGEMNIFERLVHSVYGKNDSAVDVDRVTVQGYIVETNKGFVLFR